jgi:hypothetical protein
MKSKLIFIAVLWLITLLSAVNYFVWRPLVDEAGIAVNQSQAALAAEQGQGEGEMSGEPDAAVPVSATGSSVFASIYNVTKNIPAVVSENYSTFHWFLYPLPLIATVWLVRWRRGITKKHRARLAFVMSNLKTVKIMPSVKDTNPWKSSDSFWEGLHDMFGSLPQNDPKNRVGFALPLAIGIVSFTGEGIGYYAQVPVPPPSTQDQEAENEAAEDYQDPDDTDTDDADPTPHSNQNEDEDENDQEDEDEDEAEDD